jgi:hypothetical protein
MVIILRALKTVVSPDILLLRKLGIGQCVPPPIMNLGPSRLKRLVQGLGRGYIWRPVNQHAGESL